MFSSFTEAAHLNEGLAVSKGQGCLSGERLSKLAAFAYITFTYIKKEKKNHKGNAKLIISVLRGSS